MLRDKFFCVSETFDDAVDYDFFMSKAGAYVMAVTNPDPSVSVLMPDHYEIYY